MTVPRPLRVMMVDDERLARLRLRQLLGEIAEPRCEVVAEAADAQEAAAQLGAVEVDALLLDIQMPGRSGLQLADTLRRLPEAPAVIFVTAHGEHALSAFELEALDYLTKPVRKERLQAAMLRVLQRRRVTAAAPVLVVTERGRVLRVPVDEVVYLKAELKYVTLRTPSATFLLDDSLAELEQRLGGAVLRIHRNTLVARKAVRALEKRSVEGSEADAADTGFGALESGTPASGPDALGWAVQVDPTGEWLPVSRRQLAAVRTALTEAQARDLPAG